MLAPKDVDECSDGSLHGCTQHCNNTAGSHFCDCYLGYELQPDGLTCLGEPIYLVDQNVLVTSCIAEFI